MLTKQEKKINGHSVKTFSPSMAKLLDSIMKEGMIEVTPSTEAEVRDGNGEFLDVLWRNVLSLFMRINEPVISEAQVLWNISDLDLLQWKGETPNRILREMYRINQKNNNAEDYYKLDAKLDTRYHDVNVTDIMDLVGYDAITNKGRFAVRFTKHLWDVLKIKSDAMFKTSVGNTYNNFKEPSNKFMVKIVDTFSWHDGEFGKDDSCWWGCYKNSRDTLSYYGGYCLQRFNGSGDGIGRFWLLPISDTCLIGFNAYGFSGREASSIIARKLEIETGKQWVFGKRGWRNTSEDSDYPYINGNNGHNNEGGSKVFAIYTGEKPDNDIVMCLDRHADFYKSDCCCNCGDDLDLDNNNYYDINGEIWCESCRDNHYTCCDECNEEIRNDNINSVDDGVVCNDCLRRHYTECDRCGEFQRDDDVIMQEFSDRSGVYCPRCWDYLYQFTCPTCEDSYSDRYNPTIVDDVLYCDDCGSEAQAVLDAENDEVA